MCVHMFLYLYLQSDTIVAGDGIRLQIIGTRIGAAKIVSLCVIKCAHDIILLCNFIIIMLLRTILCMCM